MSYVHGKVETSIVNVFCVIELKRNTGFPVIIKDKRHVEYGYS